MCGIDSVDIEAVIGFGVAEVFGLLEGSGKIGTRFGHAREDVVGRPVDDAMETEELVGDESFPEDFDDRDTSGDAGFEIDGGVGLASMVDEFVAAFREKGFIGGDKGFASVKAGLGNFKRFVHSPHEFDNDLDRGICDNFFPVSDGCDGQTFSRFCGILDGSAFDLQVDIKTLLKKRIGFGKITDQPGSDRATTDEANAKNVHLLITPKVRGILKHGKRVGGSN